MRKAQGPDRSRPVAGSSGSARALRARALLPMLAAAAAPGAWLGAAALLAAPAARGDDLAMVSDLGEVVVQARRRDEHLADVPAAVSVQTAEQLQDQNAVVFGDIARALPNVRMMPSPQSVSALDVTMRGQTAIRSAIDYDPAVGIYVDGVYVANGQAAMNTLLDIDTVEVVRGAQGTLFGRNNTGGSISFNTMRPQLGRTSAEVSADAGAAQLFVGRGIFNLSLGETLALRLAYQANDRAGYGASLASGQGNFDNQSRQQWRIGALWKPDADVNAYWTYEQFDADEVGALLHPLHGTQVELLGQQLGLAAQQFPLAGITPVVIPDNPFQTDADFPAHDRTHLKATQLTLNRALGAQANARLVLGYRHLHNDTAIDVDATALPFANTNLFNTSTQKSAELQLSGLALAARLDWVGGLYWFRDDGSAPSVLAPPSAAYQQLYQLLQVPFSSPYPVVESNAVQNLSSAAFWHGEFHLDERWSAAAGLRHTNDTRRLSENSYAQVPGFGQSCTILDATTGAPAGGGGPCPAVDKSVGYGYWSWELSTRYRLSRELNAYFRSGRGQRSGGWNAPLSTIQDQPFHPEQLTDYELGLKADLLGGALLVAGDLFYGNYDQMQRLLPRLVAGTPTTVVVNAGKAAVSGAELEATMAVSRAARLQGALGWTDARYRQFQYAADPTQPPADLSGNRFNQTPRLNASLGAGYDAALAGGTLRLHGDYAWQDTVQFNVINDFNAQGAYGTLNARMAYAGAGDTWEVALFGTNLAGRQYAITGGSIVAPPAPLPAVSWQIPGAPRFYGIEFTYRVGGSRRRSP